MRKILRLLTLCVAVSCAVYFFFSFTQIKEVICQLDSGEECPNGLAQNIQKQTMNQSLFFGSHNLICDQLKKQRLEIESCEVEKIFPEKIVLRLVFVPLRYTLFFPEKNLFYVIDQKGNIRNSSMMGDAVVRESGVDDSGINDPGTDGSEVGNTVAMEHLAEKSLPALQIAPELEKVLSQHSPSPQLHSYILELLAQLPTIPFGVDHIVLLNDREAQIFLKSGMKVWVELSHLSVQLAKLDAVLKQLPSITHTQTHPVSEIDLRFKYPVLRE